MVQDAAESIKDETVGAVNEATTVAPALAPSYLHGVKLIIVLGALMLSLFLVGLDFVRLAPRKMSFEPS